MDAKNKEIIERTKTVTKTVSLKKEGQLEQVRYYCDDKEISSELYDKKGVLLHRTGIIPDGIVREYYRAGAVKNAIAFEDGRAHGKGIDYYPSGEIREENTFRQGLLHGPSKMYRLDGTLWVEADYNYGKLHGIFTSYHDNGSAETKAEYRDGKLNGYYAKHNRYGSLVEEGTFSRGKKQGGYKSYYETGQLARVERYRQGKLVYLEEFDEDGKTVKSRQKNMPGGDVMKGREIYITEHDMERLRALIEIYNGDDAPYIERLEEELDKAKVVDSKNIPNDVVTMNSIVRIKDLDSGEEKTLILVFPNKTGVTERAVSILAPIGTALIGYREGDAIEWEVPAGKKRLQIIEIIYQPERIGNFDL